MPYPYSFIEEWWGESLSPELQNRIEHSPVQHIETFLSDFSETSDRIWRIPPRRQGILRPLLRPIKDSSFYVDDPASLSMALNVLLYAHEIVIESPISSLSAKDLPRQTAQLLAIKPLVDSGVIHLGNVGSRSSHPSIFANDFFEARPVVRDSLPELYAALGADHLDEIVAQVTGIINLAGLLPNRANPIARDEIEFKVMTTILRKAWTDRTYFDLASLARLSVPNLDGKISELIAVRQSEESFAVWRNALSQAMTQLAKIPDDEDDWQRDARDIVYTELEPLRQNIIRANARSNALSVLNRGRSAMLIAGAGVAAGWAAGGNPASALAASSATTGITFAAAYLKGLKDRRKDKAILDLALAFNPDEGANTLGITDQ